MTVRFTQRQRATLLSLAYHPGQLSTPGLGQTLYWGVRDQLVDLAFRGTRRACLTLAQRGLVVLDDCGGDAFRASLTNEGKDRVRSLIRARDPVLLQAFENTEEGPRVRHWVASLERTSK